MNKHDASYRLLFSNPKLIHDLFHGILRPSWLADADWHKLESLPSQYVGDKLSQRQGDIVWRLPRRDKSDLYLMLMIEHQSSIDKYMALRVLTYVGLLSEALVARNLIKRGHSLPVTLPIVIYSGAPRWSAAQNVVDLFDPAPATLGTYLPRLEYLLVDEGAILEEQTPTEDNLATLLFRLEHNRGLQDVEKLLQKVYNYTKADSSLRRAFVSWTRHVLLPRALPDVEIPQTEDLLEVTDMLADHTRTFAYHWMRDGRAELLRELLIQKFGELSPDVLQRLEHGTSQELQIWGENVLKAKSIKELFDASAERLKEANTLTDHSRSWTRQWMKEGQAALLRKLLTQKFGELPEDIAQRLEQASSEELEAWGANMLTADSISAVFAERDEDSDQL